MKHIEFVIAAVAFTVGLISGIVLVGEFSKNIPVESVVLYDRTYNKCVALTIKGDTMLKHPVKCPTERRGR